MKPGFTRISFLRLTSEAEIGHLLTAVEFVATKGWLFLPQYKPCVSTAAWVHTLGTSNTTTGDASDKKSTITCKPLAAFEDVLQRAVDAQQGKKSSRVKYAVCSLTEIEETKLLLAVQVSAACQSHTTVVYHTIWHTYTI